MPEIVSNVPQRAYDGLAKAAQRNSLTLTALASDILRQQGFGYANLFGIGVLTSGMVISRLTPEEYASILQASQSDADIKALIDELVSEGHIAADDERLTNGFARVVAAGLLAPERVPQILAYERPVPPA